VKIRRTPILLLAIISCIVAGCSRTRYRLAADRDSYDIIHEKSACLTEAVSVNYTVRPDTRSRFHDPTNPDCPSLPNPTPVLNGYQLPALVSVTGPCEPEFPCRLNALVSTDSQPASPQSKIANSSAANSSSPLITSDTIHEQVAAVVPASFEFPSSISPAGELKLVDDSSSTTNGADTISKEANRSSSNSNSDATPTEPDNHADSTSSSISSFNRPIPKQAWESLPKTCIDRMLEFHSIRAEYAKSFPEWELKAESPELQRLTLANFMELASINSRQYQSAKEDLFVAALALTRERYQYDLNPLQFGNGTASNYQHRRVDGATTNRLSVPTGVGVQKSLASGGEFLARFANSVVLTFNGPSGFATDIGSELVFDFQQTVFQRDIQFERLTQLERNVVYATRDYLRFRKQLFRDIANAYYNLLLNYRTIEIGSQDYFTNLRGFSQSQSEYRTAEKISRVQVDQFEQNVLRTRGNLINNCFNLESALDQLKFRLGLPTELPIYFDLTELQSLSLRDELSVARQMIQRARNELLTAKSSNNLDVTTLANVAEVLADRMANILEIQERIESSLPSSIDNESQPNSQTQSLIALQQAGKQLKQLQSQLQILGVGMQVETLGNELEKQLKSEVPAPPLLILNRALEYCEVQMQLVDLAIKRPDREPTELNSLNAEREKLAAEIKALQEFLVEISKQLRSTVDLTQSEIFAEIPRRSKDSVELMIAIKALVNELAQDFLPKDGESIANAVESTVNKTIDLSDRLLQTGPDGWQEIVLDHDEALLTGLVQRLDLMNERGQLADAWRQIKLAGDDLRSIVNLGAQQVISTRTGSENPVDFTFDNSQTRLTASLDTPLNRRLQRNNFRVALINYNLGLRNLMALEDTIKLDVREDLRQLSLDRNQYAISVASAALAYERVISTRLRLQLAVQNVAARDFLEAQQAYANALNAIARQHVNYITDRIELFFDMEAIEVDSCGFWQGVNSDEGPKVNLDFPGRNPRPYDRLPPNVRYSPTVRQMERIAPGEVEVR
jgi:hypothetical protein